MFLSRMELNPQRRGARKLLNSPQAMHAAVLSSFPPAETGDQARVLWRLDSEDARVLLYVVSPHEPCFLHLQEQAGWSTAVTWASRAYAPLLDRLANGQAYAFRLTANPTRIATGDDGRKQRVGFLRENQQVAWLLRKSVEMGVSFQSAERPSISVKGSRSRDFRRQDRTVTLMQVTFEGALVVTDADALRAALANGVGAAKAYGCGLVTLAGLPA